MAAMFVGKASSTASLKPLQPSAAIATRPLSNSPAASRSSIPMDSARRRWKLETPAAEAGRLVELGAGRLAGPLAGPVAGDVAGALAGERMKPVSSPASPWPSGAASTGARVLTSRKMRASGGTLSASGVEAGSAAPAAAQHRPIAAIAASTARRGKHERPMSTRKANRDAVP